MPDLSTPISDPSNSDGESDYDPLNPDYLEYMGYDAQKHGQTQADSQYYLQRRLRYAGLRQRLLITANQLREASGAYIASQPPDIKARQVLFMVNLIDARRAHKITQKELAQKIGSTQNTVSRWERGETSPSLGMVFKIAEAVGVSVIIE